jgi:hypothetical protein
LTDLFKTRSNKTVVAAGFLFFTEVRMGRMTIKDFKETLDTFKKDLEKSGDSIGYAKAVFELYSDFCEEKMQQPHSSLVNEIMQFVTTL